MNDITICGNLTRDPELRYSTSGAAISNFDLAVNRVYGDANDRKEEVTFFRAVAFGAFGENVTESLRKGDRVFVQGRLSQRKYTDKEGIERTSVEIIANEVGPSLRWATASISRTERQASGASRPTRDPVPAPVYGDDEEPF